jgi:O-antigen/teichoic acid export membrane protein
MAEPDSVAVRAATGGAVLSVGNFVYAAISAVGSIVVARLLGPAGYGAVSMALIYPTMLSGLADLGLSTAVMRFAALGGSGRAFAALWLRAAAGALLAAALVPLAPYLAASLQRPYVAPLIWFLSLYAFASGAAASATAFLAGVNRYWDLALASIVAAVARAARGFSARLRAESAVRAR